LLAWWGRGWKFHGLWWSNARAIDGEQNVAGFDASVERRAIEVDILETPTAGRPGTVVHAIL
jgi:hypothetical protein